MKQNKLEKSIIKLGIAFIFCQILILIAVKYNSTPLAIMGLSFYISQIYAHYLSNVVKNNDKKIKENNDEL